MKSSIVLIVICIFSLYIWNCVDVDLTNFLDEQPTKPILITHIISSFRKENAINRTFESMIASRDHANFSVQFISVHYEEDDHIPPFEFEKYLIHRSHQEILPAWNSKKLPFVQDILQVGMKHAVGDIIVFTNNDIILNQHFYSWVENAMKSRDSLTINKRLLINVPEDLPLREYYVIGGVPHGGYDCFVWKRELNSKINLGRMFVGFPPWGKSLRALLYRISKHSDEFDSWSNLTFHFGNERSWEAKTRENRIFKATNLGLQREWMQR